MSLKKKIFCTANFFYKAAKPNRIIQMHIWGLQFSLQEFLLWFDNLSTLALLMYKNYCVNGNLDKVFEN